MPTSLLYDWALKEDLDGNGQWASTANFHPLFGDVDGNGIVDGNDQLLVTNRVGQMGVDLDCDVDGHGLVNLMDVSQVKSKNGRSVKLK